MTAEDITQHAKGNDDKKAIITKELKSHLEGLYKKKTRRKSKGTGTLDFNFNYRLKTKDFGRQKKKKKETWSLRERVIEP